MASSIAVRGRKTNPISQARPSSMMNLATKWLLFPGKSGWKSSSRDKDSNGSPSNNKNSISRSKEKQENRRQRLFCYNEETPSILYDYFSPRRRRLFSG